MTDLLSCFFVRHFDVMTVLRWCIIIIIIIIADMTPTAAIITTSRGRIHSCRRRGGGGGFSCYLLEEPSRCDGAVYGLDDATLLELRHGARVLGAVLVDESIESRIAARRDVLIAPTAHDVFRTQFHRTDRTVVPVVPLPLLHHAWITSFT